MAIDGRITDYDRIADRFDTRYAHYPYDGVRETLINFLHFIFNHLHINRHAVKTTFYLIQTSVYLSQLPMHCLESLVHPFKTSRHGSGQVIQLFINSFLGH